ncbi:putative hydrophobic protein (TIGR00271 family) [Dysgonomonas sp. PFB1-18]|uniref:TIGR00341 family protein n=1 Tax=unclassified Dysgonomonas TaxID=2630389 RepID=UPI0024730160|nr:MULTISPECIES: TIGR00341 family protein [unclassified Dysgonomonas]MDH6309008.1 putative hydrophobic protein (TIGR00271 family) [Dysgonomonas sp. PF1-14]MDH6338759.1 putative hydrophobic protein (TIGR00271 family) [Dysgonomonas sp. PF1-16]MDH6380213.1 putative hydrophobic protein (TIGR00271 family) [Dysgonomonas sp. PFB1-18]MDH6397543.1 putative hydrophobic protein (TIGR00271 family) [Dysgonomonas sp. PF1-23]
MLQKLLKKIRHQGQIEDYNEIHESIKQGVVFEGTKLWILVCAIIIASVGLNINSTAVIIGAMLISPLMEPITGMGYSIAVYDSLLFRQSLKNFGFAVLASLITSTLYFAITPVTTAYSEILARTSPTIYDVLIALFGGVAGIIAISSKQKGNVIPGVAIATALMPPLCTAGYGLATGQFSFFYGAFYLFTINSVCIAFASAIISQFLKFPIRNSRISDIRKKRINQIISAIIIITILPSIYLGYSLAQDEKFKANAQLYTQDVSIYRGNYLLRSEINASKREIMLTYGGSYLTDGDKDTIVSKASDFYLKDAKISVEQGLAINTNIPNQDKSLAKEASLKQEISRLNSLITESQRQSDSIQNRPMIGNQLLSEVKVLYPQITSCSYSDTYIYRKDSIKPEKAEIVIFSYERYLNTIDQKKVREWIDERLKTAEAKVYFEKIN